MISRCVRPMLISENEQGLKNGSLALNPLFHVADPRSRGIVLNICLSSIQ